MVALLRRLQLISLVVAVALAPAVPAFCDGWCAALEAGTRSNSAVPHHHDGSPAASNQELADSAGHHQHAEDAGTPALLAFVGGTPAADCDGPSIQLSTSPAWQKMALHLLTATTARETVVAAASAADTLALPLDPGSGSHARRAPLALRI